MGAENRFLKDSKSLVEAFGGYTKNPLLDDKEPVAPSKTAKQVKPATTKQPESSKKITSINVDPVVFNKFKAVAALEGMTVSAKLEQMMLDELHKHKL